MVGGGLFWAVWLPLEPPVLHQFFPFHDCWHVIGSDVLDPKGLLGNMWHPSPWVCTLQGHDWLYCIWKLVDQSTRGVNLETSLSFLRQKYLQTDKVLIPRIIWLLGWIPYCSPNNQWAVKGKRKSSAWIICYWHKQNTARQEEKVALGTTGTRNSHTSRTLSLYFLIHLCNCWHYSFRRLLLEEEYGGWQAQVRIYTIW